MEVVHQPVDQELLQVEFGLNEVEEYLFASAPFPEDCVKSVKHPNPAKELTKLTAEDAYKDFSNGSTLILRSLHRRIPAIARLAGAVGNHLGVEIRVNAYITPPNAAGFKRHIDNHDVLILQTYGEKQWNTYPQVSDLPLETTLMSDIQSAVFKTSQRTNNSQSSTAPPALHTLLKSKEFLFLPKGVPHEGRTSEQASVHLSLGYIYPSQAEINSLAVFKSSLENADGKTHYAPTAPLSHISLSDSDYSEMHTLMEIRRQESLIPAPGRFLETINQLASLKDTSALQWRPNISPKLITWKGCLMFLAHKQLIPVSGDLKPVWFFLEKQRSFLIHEIPLLALEERLIFAQELVKLGLLEILPSS